MIIFHSGQTVYSRKIVSGPLKIISADSFTNNQKVEHFTCEASDGQRYSIPKLYLSSKPIVEVKELD